MSGYTNICSICNKEFNITISALNERKRKNIPLDLCSHCSRSIKKKEYHNNLSPEKKEIRDNKLRDINNNLQNNLSKEEKKLIAKKRSITIINKSAEEKKITKEKTQLTWKNKSPKVKKAYGKKCSIRFKKMHKNRTMSEKEIINKKISNTLKEYHKTLTPIDYHNRTKNQVEAYNNLSDKEKEEYKIKSGEWWRNLSLEEQLLFAAIRKDWWYNLTDEEYIDQCKKISEGINNRSDEEKEESAITHSKRVTKLWEDDEYRFKQSQSHIRYYENLSEEEKIEYSKLHKEWWNNLSRDEQLNHIDKIRNWWNTLSTEQFEEWYLNRNIGYQEYINNIGILPNKNELSFIDDLNKYDIKYEYQYLSQIKHKDFYNIFSYNPVTNGSVSWQHWWDFIVYTKQGNILVDIDGSIHNEIKNNIIRFRNNLTYKDIDYIKFNDSKRPYQTDGLDSYIIGAYNDKITNDIKVLHINSNKYMNYQEFINIIINRNIVTNKDIKKILKNN